MPSTFRLAVRRFFKEEEQQQYGGQTEGWRHLAEYKQHGDDILRTDEETDETGGETHS